MIKSMILLFSDLDYIEGISRKHFPFHQQLCYVVFFQLCFFFQLCALSTFSWKAHEAMNKQATNKMKTNWFAVA